MSEDLGDILAPFGDPSFAELLADRMRDLGAIMKELGRSAGAVLERMRLEPSPFRIQGTEPVRVGCGCLCAVEHGGLGVCVSVAVPDLKVLSDPGVTQQWVAVCRPCFGVRGGR